MSLLTDDEVKEIRLSMPAVCHHADLIRHTEKFIESKLEQGKRDAVPVSIDSLLRTHPNLHQAVSILIQGANSKALYLWDQARQAETRAAAPKQEK